jgi:type VI protein secretion system component Hcp
MITRPRFGYLQIKLARAKVQGEGAATDPAHKPDYWMPLYDFCYRVYGRDKDANTGRAQNLAQLAVTCWKDAMNNASPELFKAIASGTQIEWALVHVMGKNEKNGEPSAHYKFRFEDGAIGEWGFEDRQTDKGIDALEVVKFTAKRVGFRQEVLGKGDKTVVAAYDFGKPDKTELGGSYDG